MALDAFPLMVDTWARAAVSLVPVCLYLVALVALDSYKLVHLRALFGAMAAGAAAAGASFVIHDGISSWTGWSVPVMARYIGPAVEEMAKAVFVVFLIRSRRVGFLVDAAILGFAVGSGFAVAENTYYLHTRPEATPITWMVRGLGTAVMHGGTAAVLAMISKTLFDRKSTYAAFLPGTAAAVTIHSFFNHFVLPPAVMTGVLFLTFAGLIAVVFSRSERATRRWLGKGFDADQRLLEHLVFHSIREDRLGRFLQELTRRFRGDVVADMLCLIRLRAELSIMAKGMLLMRKAGFPSRPRDVGGMLEEIRHLEHRIGPTGLLALTPVLRPDDRDLWQRHLLGSAD